MRSIFTVLHILIEINLRVEDSALNQSKPKFISDRVVDIYVIVVASLAERTKGSQLTEFFRNIKGTIDDDDWDQESVGMCGLCSSKKCLPDCFSKWKCGRCLICCTPGCHFAVHVICCSIVFLLLFF
ncbi:hypothetical protein GQ457_06G018160 [Hibiscus cannabinus]